MRQSVSVMIQRMAYQYFDAMDGLIWMNLAEVWVTCILAQVVDQRANPFHLMDDGRDFLAYGVCLVAENDFDQLDMPEDDGGGIVDLMPDACREFPECCQLLAGQQLRACFAQQADMLLQCLAALAQRVRLCAQVTRAVLDLGFQGIGGRLNLAAVRLQPRQHGIEFLRQLIQLITTTLFWPKRGKRPDAQPITGGCIANGMHHMAYLANGAHQALDPAPDQ
ncbi:hypothetical protein [Cobetia sp. ICG0124]|uniref:hypothetical protein n=1 Tax=Cobetia sp. ICG0124 TaxID=2053669 RepID=UPI001F0BB096|nr:hypothetical protein [Cobetia sp. ICG0124]